PKYKAGLESFARITSTGITGATYEGIKEGIKKEEMPTPQELLKYGAEWAVFETVLQSLGYTARFVNALRKSKGNTVDKVNSVIKKVNLQENNPETLKKQLDEAMNEVFAAEKPKPKAEVEGVKKAVEKPEKKGNLPETQPETKKVPEQKQTPEAKQKNEVKEFEQKVENKETSKIQNKID